MLVRIQPPPIWGGVAERQTRPRVSGETETNPPRLSITAVTISSSSDPCPKMAVRICQPPYLVGAWSNGNDVGRHTSDAGLNVVGDSNRSLARPVKAITGRALLHSGENP